MFSINKIQQDLFATLNGNLGVPIYFYIPKKVEVPTYAQINSLKVIEQSDEDAAIVAVKILVRSTSKSSRQCIDVIDIIYSMQNQFSFSASKIINIYDFERHLTINPDRSWSGEISFNFLLVPLN
jgi:hypothetical protein